MERRALIDHPTFGKIWIKNVVQSESEISGIPVDELPVTLPEGKEKLIVWTSGSRIIRWQNRV